MTELQHAIDDAAAPKWSHVVIVVGIAICAVLYYHYHKLKENLL